MWLVKNKQLTIIQLFHFTIIGCINTFLGISIIMLMKYININDFIASFTGYFLGYLFSFILNKNLTFKNFYSKQNTFLHYTLVYIAVYSITFLWVTVLSILFATQYLHHIMGIPVFFILNFLGCKYLVFKNH